MEQSKWLAADVWTAMLSPVSADMHAARQRCHLSVISGTFAIMDHAALIARLWYNLSFQVFVPDPMPLLLADTLLYVRKVPLKKDAARDIL